MERPAAEGEDTAPQAAPHFLVDGGTGGSRNGRTAGAAQEEPGRSACPKPPARCEPRAEGAGISVLQEDADVSGPELPFNKITSCRSAAGIVDIHLE